MGLMKSGPWRRFTYFYEWSERERENTMNINNEKIASISDCEFIIILYIHVHKWF